LPKKILIADQSETVRGIAESLFRKRGFEIVSACDGLEAIDLVRTAGVDLAFLNSSLPEMDGYTVSKQIKSDHKTAGVKTVLLLSTSEIVNQHQLLSSLADDTLNKPFSPQDLIDTTAQVLNVEIEGESNGAVSDRRDLGDDVHEFEMEEGHDAEVDFSALFTDDQKDDKLSQQLDGIFLANAKGRTDDQNEVEDVLEEPAPKQHVAALTGVSKGRSPDEPIVLSEDQYGLGRPTVETEIVQPHDYSWFVREMKKEITGERHDQEAKGALPDAVELGGPKPAAVPGVPATRTTSTGQFAAEEIGSSKIDISRIMPATPLPAELPVTGLDDSQQTDPVKLTLAEKLLIKEVADKLAEKMLEKYSGDDLRRMVSEILTTLKKM
jgi:CheY-like chemotaxis protein